MEEVEVSNFKVKEHIVACLDESGIHASATVCVLAGYIGSLRQWLRFDSAWRAVLGQYDVADFHSKDFFSFDPQSGERVGHYRRLSDPTVRGNYRDWRRGDADEFVRALLGIVRAHRLYTIGGLVDVSAFRGLTHGERRYLTGGVFNGSRWLSSGAPTKPYFLLATHCLSVAAARTGAGKKLLLVFDRQREYEKGATEHLFRSAVELGRRSCFRDRFGGAIFEDRVEVPGLQAADLYVHCWHRYATEPKRLGRDRSNVLDVLTVENRRMQRYDADHLERMLSRLPRTFRAALREWPEGK